MQTSPKTAIILGTGLGQLASEITDSYEFSYQDIPNFPVSTVEGHAGCLIFGKLGGKDILAMKGRFHYYEGYNMQEVTFPIRVMYELGIETLFVSNARKHDFQIGIPFSDGLLIFPINAIVKQAEKRHKVSRYVVVLEFWLAFYSS